MFPSSMASLTPVKSSKSAPRSLSFATNTTERTVISPEGSPYSEALSTPLTAHSIESPTFYARLFRQMEEEHKSSVIPTGHPPPSPSASTLPTTTSLATDPDPDALSLLQHSQREAPVSRPLQEVSDLQLQTFGPRHGYSKTVKRPEYAQQQELRRLARLANHQAQTAARARALSSIRPTNDAGPSQRTLAPQSMAPGQAPRTRWNLGEDNEAAEETQSSQASAATERSQVAHGSQALQDVQAVRDVEAPQDVQVLQADQPAQITQDAKAAQEDQEATASVQIPINAQAVQPLNVQVSHQFSAQAQPFLPAQSVQPVQPVQPIQPVQPYDESFSATEQIARLLHGLSAIQIQAVPRTLIYDSQRNLLPQIPSRSQPSPHHERRASAEFEPRKLTLQVKAPGHFQHCQCLACLFPKMVNPPCDPSHIETRIDNLGCLCPGRGGRLGMQRMVPCFKHDWGARWGWLARGGPWKDGVQRTPARIPEICQRPIDPVVFRDWIEGLPCRCEEWKISWNKEAEHFRLAIQENLWHGAGIRCSAWLQQCLAKVGRYQSTNDIVEAVREMLNIDFELHLAPIVQSAWDYWRQNPGVHSRYALMEPAPPVLQNDPQFQVQFAAICGEYIAPNLWLQSLGCDCGTWKDEWKRLIQMLWDAHPVSAALQILPWSHLARAELKREWQRRKHSLRELRRTNLATETTRRQRLGVTITPPFNDSDFANHEGRFTDIYPYMGQRFGNTAEDPIIANRLNFLGHKSIWRPSVKDDGEAPYIQQPYDRAGSVIWPNTADCLWYGPMWHQGEGGIFGRVLPPVMQRFPPYHAPVPRNGWKVRPRFHREQDAAGNIRINLRRDHDENEPVYGRYDGLWDESRRGRPIRPDERSSGQSREGGQGRDGRPKVHVREGNQGKPEDQDVRFEDPGLDMLPFDALWSEPHYGPRNGLRDPPFDNQADRARLGDAEERGMREEEQRLLLSYLVEALNEPDIMELDDGGAAAEAELERWKAVSRRLPKRSRYFLIRSAGEWAMSSSEDELRRRAWDGWSNGNWL